ncbi:MAG: hypothetical protein GQ534_10095 [Candidatus Delongbacteria bacterium]|nr:hypothetical protein [Candidatus Delongbacteria bacterium]
MYNIDEKNRIITINIGIEYSDKVVIFSVIGCVGDLFIYFESMKKDFPRTIQGVPAWIKDLYKIQTSKKIKLLPLNNICGLGILKFRRNIIFRNEYELFTKKDYLMIKLKDASLAEKINKEQLLLAPINYITKTKCGKCSREYYSCNCIQKRENFANTIEESMQIGCFPTNHKAIVT